MRWKLRTTFRGFTLGIVAALGTAVLLVTWEDGRASVRDSSHALIQGVADVVEQKVDEHLKMPDRALELTADLLSSGALDRNKGNALRAYFTDFLEIHPEVSALRFRGLAGGRVEVVRTPAGRIVVSDPPEDGTRGEMEWFLHWTTEAEPSASSSSYWGRVEPSEELGVPVVTGSLPIFGPDQTFSGVVAVELSLLDLSRFLSGVKIGNTGEAFLADSQGRLLAIAMPDAILRSPSDSLEAGLRTLQDAHRPELGIFSTLPQVESTLAGNGPARLRFHANDTPYLGSLAALDRSPEGRWFVGILVPEDDFLGPLKRTLLYSGMVLLLLLFLALLVGDWFSRYVSRSLDGVVRETEQVRQLDFASAGPADSFFQELYDVLTAFEGMKTGLRSFARFVPVTVVKRLVKSGKDARREGELRTVTLLFSDIQDFTALSEGMDPVELTEELDDYFTGLVRAVEESGGIVDKYMGDGLMAFWGAPEEMKDHPVRAVEAALAAGSWVETLPPGSPASRFRTRFGLHTGEALVGIMGGGGRLSYSCIGESVNLASRMEGLNKLYGTSLIVTQATMEGLDGKFDTRELDRVVVKGASQPITIFEVLGPAGEVEDPRLRDARRYEEGLSLFRDRRFDEAVALLEPLQEDDPPARFLLERCRKLRAGPPGSDWDGALRLSSK